MTGAIPVVQGVPVIDASKFLSEASADIPPPQDAVDQIADACASWGFFQLVNHGVEQELIDRHFEATKRFFALPTSVKQSAKRSADNSMGYFSEEYTKQKLDLKEGFDFRVVAHPELPDDHPDNHDPQGTNRWPQGEEEFRAINERYLKEVARLSFKLLEVVALGLGLQPKALHHLFQPAHSSMLRLNHYPVTPHAAPDALGISDHKDPGFLTVLVQDYEVPGLQVLRDGVWHLVEPLRDAFTINVGDMLQVLSNDRFIASNHRVMQSKIHSRFSRAFFFNPSPDAVIAPQVGAKVGDGVPHYKNVPWKEFYLARIDGNYADLGEEVQIDWYRTDREQPVAVPAK